MRNFRNLNIWKDGIALVAKIYQMATLLPEDEKFGLTSQIKRASVSIPSNIAEGIGRNSKKETKQFCYIAKGSLYEVETQIYLALDLRFVQETQIEEVLNQLVTVRKLIIGFIKYLDK